MSNAIIDTRELNRLCGQIDAASESRRAKDLKTYLGLLEDQIHTLYHLVRRAAAEEYNASRGPLLYSFETDYANPLKAAKALRAALKHGHLHAYFSAEGKDSGAYVEVFDARVEKGQLRLKVKGYAIPWNWSTSPPGEVWRPTARAGRAAPSAKHDGVKLGPRKKGNK